PTLKFGEPRYGESVHDDRYRPSTSHGATYTSGLMSVWNVPRSLKRTMAVRIPTRSAATHRRSAKRLTVCLPLEPVRHRAQHPTADYCLRHVGSRVPYELCHLPRRPG